jgi:hypothetical protein
MSVCIWMGKPNCGQIRRLMIEKCGRGRDSDCLWPRVRVLRQHGALRWSESKLSPPFSFSTSKKQEWKQHKSWTLSKVIKDHWLQDKYGRFHQLFSHTQTYLFVFQKNCSFYIYYRIKNREQEEEEERE